MAYKTVLTGGQGEIEVKKSRFIANTHPVCSEREAQDYLESIRKKYWDARHNCYAYTIGSRFGLQRSSDDGEPAQTAGRPILELLLKEEIHDCIIVVTRYFGGTLLGTGGLIRAYREAAQLGIDHSVIAWRCEGRRYTVQTDYNSLGKLQFYMAGENIPVTDTRYTDTVGLDVIVPIGGEEAFVAKVAEMTGACAMIEPKERIEYADAGGKLVLFPDREEESDDV